MASKASLKAHVPPENTIEYLSSSSFSTCSSRCRLPRVGPASKGCGATAPAGSKDASQKQAHADQVFAALDKIADSKIDLTIDAMSPDAGDVLLKYVYKGLETPSDRTPSLLKWQAKLAEKFGVGSIVRVLSDRKTV